MKDEDGKNSKKKQTKIILEKRVKKRRDLIKIKKEKGN